ncbi:MAG TPA: hypothetical protein VH760_10555 [Gaiellaceae bacterium]
MLRTTLTAGVAVVVLAGCGGSHDLGGPAPTNAGFAAAADRVCRETKTHRARLAGLRKLRPPLDERDLFQRWLSAERLAVSANDVIAGRKQPEEPAPDALVQRAVALGKIAGYAGRLGARACRGAPGVTMTS